MPPEMESTAAPPLRKESTPLRKVVALLLLVGVIAGWLYFNRLGEPRAPVWDETYYLTTTARYHQGLTQFSSHPPLGTMLIAAGDQLSGKNAGADWHAIGAAKAITREEMPPGFDYAGPRLAPAAAGVIAAVLFALLMVQLTGSVPAAAALSLLVLADSALLVQFRTAQLDAFQLVFLLAALLSALWALRRQSRWAYILFGLFVAAAALVRANGLMMGALAPFMLWPLLQERDWRGLALRILNGLHGAFLAAIVVLAAWIHFTSLPPDVNTPAGRQDMAFVSPQHAYAWKYDAWNLRTALAAASDIQRFMAHDLAITPHADANGSHPAQWLIGQGLIRYRTDAAGAQPVSIGLVPNLAVWLISLLGVLTSLIPARLKESPLRAMLLAGWIANMAALQWLDFHRVLYLYHYFIPLLLGHAMAALEWRHHGLPRRPALILAPLVVAAGVLAWPLATGRMPLGWLIG